MVTSCSVVSFLFECDGPPRDLHSFPTRRSSDLRGFHRVDAVGEHAVVVEGLTKTFGTVEALRGIEDRKSTRLNSSHMSISYAVFCLKKKKAAGALEQAAAASPQTVGPATEAPLR